MHARAIALTALALGTLAGARAFAAPPDLERAQEACRRVAHDKGFGDIQLDQSPLRSGPQAIVAMKATRNGDRYTGNCTYDRHDQQASLSLERAGRGQDRRVDAAVRSCRDEAEHESYRVRDVRDARPERDGVLVSLALHHNGKDLMGECRYHDGRASLDIRHG